MDYVWALVPKLQRSRNVKGMPAVSVTGIHEVLAELIRWQRHDILITIPKFNMDLSIHIVFVPNPARNRRAVRVLDLAGKMRQRGGPNASRKNQQAEANKLERDEDGHGPRSQTVPPIAVRLIPAGKM